MYIPKRINDLSDLEIERFIVKHGIDVYDLCPCGSGDKFKFCCLINKQVENNNELKAWLAKSCKDIWDNDSLFTKQCCYDNCVADSIGSHSIQRGRYLKMIEPNDNHYILRYTYNLKNRKMIPYLRREYKNQATTFYGFCSPHDTSIFEIIESNNLLTFTKDQLYAFVYRSLAYTYDKLCRLNKFKIYNHLSSQPKIYLNRIYKRNMLVDQFDFINSYRANLLMVQHFEKYMRSVEKNFTVDSNGNCTWNIIDSLLVFSNIRKIKVSDIGFVFQTTRVMIDPRINEGNLNIEERVELEQNNLLTTYVLPYDKTSEQIIFFAIKSTADSYLKEYFLNLVNTSDDDIIRDIVNNIMLDGYEELYFSQDYYNSLSKQEKDLLEEQIRNQCEGIKPILDLGNVGDDCKINFLK